MTPEEHWPVCLFPPSFPPTSLGCLAGPYWPRKFHQNGCGAWSLLGPKLSPQRWPSPLAAPDDLEDTCLFLPATLENTNQYAALHQRSWPLPWPVHGRTRPRPRAAVLPASPFRSLSQTSQRRSRKRASRHATILPHVSSGANPSFSNHGTSCFLEKHCLHRQALALSTMGTAVSHSLYLPWLPSTQSFNPAKAMNTAGRHCPPSPS